MIIKFIILTSSFLILALNSYAFESYLRSDTIIRKDTNKINSKFKTVDTEKTIKFDDSKLAPVNIRIIFNDFFAQYIKIKESLVYKDPNGAGSNTLILLDKMKAKSDEISKETKDARWDIFINNYDNIKSKIKSLRFINEQRFMFGEISRGMLTFFKQYGLNNKTVYLMSYRDDELNVNNVWLSDKRDNKNPFTGEMNDTVHTKVNEVWIFD